MTIIDYRLSIFDDELTRSSIAEGDGTEDGRRRQKTEDGRQGTED